MRFEKGQIIKVRDRKYRITGIDVTPVKDKVIQYDLDLLDNNIPARLKPHTDGFTLIEYHDVSDKIKVVEK